MTPHQRRRCDRYVQYVLDLYRATPGTRARARPADRRLAETLYRQHVSPHIVRAALILAAARRLSRPADAEPLLPINSLHYFLPVIREIQARPLEDDYLRYLELKIAATDHHSDLAADHPSM